MTSPRRIGCVHIPSFPIAVAARAAAEAGNEALAAGPAGVQSAPPLVLVAGLGNRARVQAANPAALAAGVRPGLHTAVRARTYAADLHVLPWDDALIERANLACTALLLEHTPAVTCAAPGHFWVDANGQERHGGDAALAKRLLQSGWEAGYPDVRVALAGSVVAAEVATTLEGSATVVVAPDPAPRPGYGVDAAFLAPLPLSRLPLPEDLREVLLLLGLESIGALADLSASSLEVRFGAPGLLARDRARGLDPRGPLCQGGPRVRLVEVPLEPPAESLEPLVFGARTALVALLRALSADGVRIARLRVHLRLGGASPPVVRDAGLSRPSTHLGPLVDRCRAVLESVVLPAPVTTLGVEVLEQVPGVHGEQGDLFLSRFRDPEALEAALSRIRARCGVTSVVRPVPVDTHRPESAGHWIPDPPLDNQRPPAPPARPPASEASLPAARRVPERGLEVAARSTDAPSAPPTALRLERRWHPLARCSPPYRRSGAWWREDAWERTDFRALTRSGARLHITREEAPEGERWTLVAWDD